MPDRQGRFQDDVILEISDIPIQNEYTNLMGSFARPPKNIDDFRMTIEKLNYKTQIPNIKQITMTKIQNAKPYL
jgi:hypothetical protein